MKNKLVNIRYELLVMLFLVFVTALVYLPVKDHGFIKFDDNEYITENSHVQAGLTLKNAAWAFTTFHTGNWHPLTWLSHMLDVQLFGLKPGGHHITNVILHIINTLLLFLVLHRMTKALWQSAFVAAVFALHPLHVESVAWVSERKDVLSTFFWLLTMGAYAFYTEKPEWKRYFPALLFFALGLMAKPMLVTLPFVLLLLDYWPLNRLQMGNPPVNPVNKERKSEEPLNPRRKKRDMRRKGKQKGRITETEKPLREQPAIFHLILEKVPFFVLAAAASIITYIAQQKGGAMEDLQHLSLPVRLANALVSYLGYIGKTIWPENLALLYPHPGILPAWQVWGAALLLAVISFLIIRGVKRFPCLAVGWLWYLGTLIPVIGLVQVGLQAMADRYTYVPLIGISIMIAWGVPELSGRWRYRQIALAAPAVCILLFFAAGTWKQVHYWENSITLFEHTLKATTGNFLIHNNYGNVLEDQGKLDDAIAQYTESLRINPRLAATYCNLGTALVNQGKPEKAISNFLKAIEINPRHAEAHYNLGTVYGSQGKIEEAIFHFRESIRIRPNYAKAYNNMGNVFLLQGKIDEAANSFRQALMIRPDYAEAHNNLGIACARQGQLEEAVSHFREAVWLRPDHKEAQYNLQATLTRLKNQAGK